MPTPSKHRPRYRNYRWRRCGLIRSIEQVEDFPELGARHLREAGVEKDDLVIGVTEGGETPYVLGAIKEAERLCIRRPFVLYCNPEDVLHRITTRTKDMIEDHRIQSIPIPVGWTAITGSTRMQASTALQLAFGLSCINEDPYAVVDRIINQVKKNHAKKLKTIIEEEARIYAQNEFVTYRTNPSLAMTVLTDTTERAPTFGLLPLKINNTQAMNTPLLMSKSLAQKIAMKPGTKSSPEIQEP